MFFNGHLNLTLKMTDFSLGKKKVIVASFMRMIMFWVTQLHTLSSGMLADNRQKLKCDKCEYKAR